MNISKKDWKLFREKLLDWQEKYMENCQQMVTFFCYSLSNYFIAYKNLTDFQL